MTGLFKLDPAFPKELVDAKCQQPWPMWQNQRKKSLIVSPRGRTVTTMVRTKFLKPASLEAVFDGGVVAYLQR